MSNTTIAPRRARVLIYQGDDLLTLQDLRRAAEVATRIEAAAVETARLGDDDPSAQEARDAFDAFALEASERAVEVVVQALPRSKYRALVAEHPPREGNETDKGFGFNEDTFREALLTYVDPTSGARTVTEPEFSTRSDLVDFLDQIADGDAERLWEKAFGVNEGQMSDPKELLYSQPDRTSSAT